MQLSLAALRRPFMLRPLVQIVSQNPAISDIFPN
jgi:hypothetical protein